MADDASRLHHDLEAVSRALQELHKQILEAEGPFIPGQKGLALLDRLINDPEWAWLRALSMSIADLDEALATDTDLTSGDAAAAAGHVRALVFGLGEPRDEAFLERYRPLLQGSAALASAHGELKRLIDALPPEPLNASERLHIRHVWAMRFKHRPR
ncbi:MAG: hypothetical protein ACREVI_13050 [Steroidobacteraceae bacterium]